MGITENANANVASQKEEKDSFQEMKSIDVFRSFKMSDAFMLIHLLKEVKDFKPYATPDQPLQITDLGGGDGDLINYFNLLSSKVVLHINEPNKTLCNKYLERAQQFFNIAIASVSNEKMEDAAYQISECDVVIASHSLYYTAKAWKQAPTVETLDDHLFSKFSKQLKANGVFCAVLQSGESTHIPGKYGHDIANLEALEDLLYPMIEKARHGTPTSNRDRDAFTNAEELDSALGKYVEQFNQSTTERYALFKSSLPVNSCVDLGNVNFAPSPETGKYEQPEGVLSILNQYTRGKYNAFSAEEQKQLLDFIGQNCQTKEGHYVVTHVNRAVALWYEKSSIEQSRLNLSNSQ